MPLFNSDILVNVDYHPGFKSGKYYCHTPFISNYTSSTNVFVADTLIYTPIFVPKRISIDRLGLRVAADVAGSSSRMGIYHNSSEGLPGNLLLDVGAINTSTTGFRESSINLNLNIGWYWLAANCNAPPNIAISATFYGSSHFLGLSAPPSVGNSFTYQQPSVSYGAMPSTAPVDNLSAKSNIPLYWFRAA
jgi:hypothetical protein